LLYNKPNAVSFFLLLLKNFVWPSRLTVCRRELLVLIGLHIDIEKMK